MSNDLSCVAPLPHFPPSARARSNRFRLSPKMSTVITRFAPRRQASAHRRGAHGFVQLALRCSRQVPAAHRGHRSRMFDTSRSGRDSDGPKWLGLAWDGEAISQFQRAERHREVASSCLLGGAIAVTSVQEPRKCARRPVLKGSRCATRPLGDRDPAASAGRRQARDPPAREPRGRDRHRRQGARQSRLRQRRSLCCYVRRQSDLRSPSS